MTGQRRATMALGLGSAVSGLLAYVVFAMLTRGLGSSEAAPVSVLWTYWAFAGAAVTFPLQHWITRIVVTDGEIAVRRAAPGVSLVVLALAVALGALAWVVRGQLFHRQDVWFPVLVALLTIGSALIGVVRGGLGARGRFTAVAWSLVAENALRCVLVGGLLLLGVTSAPAHGLCLVAGQVVVVLWPSALHYGKTGGKTHGAEGATASISPLAFLTGAGLAQLISQAVLTGGPVLLALAGGAAREVTSLFAALALFRAPYMLALGAVPQLTLRVARFSQSGESGSVSRLVKGTVALTSVTAVLAGLFAAWVGPELLTLVFGHDVHLGALACALVAVGCTVAVANLILMVIALAHEQAAQAARGWTAATAVAALAFVAFSALDPVQRTVEVFLVAEVVAFVVLLLVTARALAPAHLTVPAAAPADD